MFSRYLFESVGLKLLAVVIVLDLPELGANGPALFTNIVHNVSIQNSLGNVVTSTFHHPPSTQVLDVLFEGESQANGVTDNHLFWSVKEQIFDLLVR